MAGTATAETMRIQDAPGVVAAHGKLEPLRRERERLEEERREARRVAGLVDVWTHDAQVDATDESIALARVRLGEVDVELLRLAAKIRPAERALAEAIEIARRERLDAIEERQRTVVAKLDAALTRVERVNVELARLDEQASALNGGSFHWPELLPEGPAADTKLAAWRRAAQSHGLLSKS